ncbi:MAG TPA: hypothetical protein VH000_04260 [Rhizomicrobium sp.]|jgi:hypothetical protein|nr:hypothetical protein [Rhizomicrobium sp.]
MIALRYALLPAAIAVFSLAAPCAHAAAPQWVSGPNACNVLNDAAAKKLLGPSAHLARKVQTNPHMSQCQYSSSNGVITIMVGDWRMIHTASPGEKKIAGLGDEAYSDPTSLYVRKGAVGMSVDVIVQSGEFWGAAADDALSQMATVEKKTAVALLPGL